MTRISRFKLRDEVSEKIFELFFEIVGKERNKSRFLGIIKDLLSPTERVMVAKRIAILYLLLKGIEAKQIIRTLKVSSGTVSKFQVLKDHSEALLPAFNDILASNDLQLLLQEVFQAIFPPGKYGVDWSAAWERERKIERLKREGI